MSKFTDKIKALKPTKRKIIQLYTALLFNANIRGFSSGFIYEGDTKKVCMPGLNCYSCPGAVTACPLGSLQGSFSADKSTVYYVFGILLLYCILFGRMICGWLCPFGLIQELLFKVKTPKLKKSPVTRILSYFKYVFLVFFVFIVPIMYAFRDTPMPAFCKYICPAGTLEGGIGLLANKVNEGYFSMLGPLFTWKFMILVSIIVGSIFIFRLFCRFICPLGALYGLFNRISVFGIKVEQHKCTHCGMCINKCRMDIKHVGDQECISCGDCVDVCPTKAIVWKGIKKKKTLPETVNGNEKKRLVTRIISALLLVALLVCTIGHYWIYDINNQHAADDNNVGDKCYGEELNIGNNVGDKCYGEDLNIILPDGISSDTIDPTSTGKITIINFWGTWCMPCVGELPYFDKIASDYKDDVSVIAVHTMMGIDAAPEYIKEHYTDTLITFASDTEGEGYYSKLGGTQTYPYTVIINEKGIVIEKFLKTLTYEDLQQVVENELKK